MSYCSSKDEDKPGNIWTSGYQPSQIITHAGSGSNLNGQLIAQTNLNHHWPISSFGTALPLIAIKHVKYGKCVVSVLDRINETLHQSPILTTKEKLEEIRTLFGLSISHLAKVLLTSRPSLHAWLEGAEPRDQSIARIDQIYQITLTWRNMSSFHYSPDRLMRQSLGDSISMLKRLERENINSGEIKDGLNKLLTLMQRHRKQMDQAKERSTKIELTEKEKDNIRHNLTQSVYSK